MERMKRMCKRIWCIAESLGRARAASSMARQGNHKLAKEIMLQKHECC